MIQFHEAAEVAPVLRARLLSAVVTTLVLAIAASSAGAQSNPIVYPSKGQSLEQQATDETACRGWAQQQTGFNPSQGPASAGTAPVGGEVVRGAGAGALIGVVGGAIGGNAGKGAAIGAGVGATAGLLRKSQKKSTNRAAEQQAADEYSRQLDGYNRAFATCMQGRGYAVN